MDRIDRFPDQNSSLLDASRAEWLPVDAPAASPKDGGPSTKDKDDRREQNVRRALVTTREKQRALADASGTAPRLLTQPTQIASGGMIQSVSGDAAPLLGMLGTGLGCPAVVSPAVPNSATTMPVLNIRRPRFQIRRLLFQI